jgi:hypothetical protein
MLVDEVWERRSRSERTWIEESSSKETMDAERARRSGCGFLDLLPWSAWARTESQGGDLGRGRRIAGERVGRGEPGGRESEGCWFADAALGTRGAEAVVVERRGGWHGGTRQDDGARGEDTMAVTGSRVTNGSVWRGLADGDEMQGRDDASGGGMEGRDGAGGGGIAGKGRRWRGWDAGKGWRGRGRDCRKGTARAGAGLQGGRWRGRGLERGHGEGGGRPRSSLKV